MSVGDEKSLPPGTPDTTDLASWLARADPGDDFDSTSQPADSRDFSGAGGSESSDEADRADDAAEAGTEFSPSLPAPMVLGPADRPVGVAAFPGPGGVYQDFEILHTLGEGSFGRVFLARQISLDRQVALKVSADRGHEARTMAGLEHDHIVKVFSEAADAELGLRVLCMQYVPGTTLERVIRAVIGQDLGRCSGRTMLDIIDKQIVHPTVFHPSALRDRELLAQSDWVQAVCWVGARLAEALDYAHHRGVLHRDVKPANVLINPYGRPLLADFNLSFQAKRTGQAAEDDFGGTLSYMAPEHLDAFNLVAGVSPDVVDARSDLYSLGVVVYELLTGHKPFHRPPMAEGSGRTQLLTAMAADRRRPPPSLRIDLPDAPEALDRVLARCLDPRPGRRFQTGAELARVLDGCRRLRRAEQELPAPGPIARAALRRPFKWLLVLTLLPHAVGSLVNIPYNLTQIVDRLTEAQQEAFHRLVAGYNLIAYPAAVWLCLQLARPVYRAWGRLTGPDPPDDAEMASLRAQVLSWPRWIVIASCIGWLPGGLLFPWGLDMQAGPVGADVFGHFLVSFTISGLIALTYSFFAVQFVVLRVFYPRFWTDAADMESVARRELGGVATRLRLFQWLAGVIPLAGAALMVGVGPEVSGYRTFRVLVTGLIATGMAGFGLALFVSGVMTQTLAVLTGMGRGRD